ncbi:MAG: hydroxyacid dehydrogenase [Moraxellaceae bacterium]|nr:MAG: hydroxyacid dehydrogenase [Moraxellaceae bacterium]
MLWHVLTPVTQQLLDQAPQLKFIQKVGVGVNTIDLDAAKARGIRVCNMPGSNSNAVAEVTIMLILATLKQLTKMDRITRSGRWRLSSAEQERLFELRGKTVGFVGYGSIPQLVSPILEAMGAKVIYTATAEKSNVNYPYMAFDALLASADIVSLHVGLNEQTTSMMNARAFQTMKPGSVFINTARGGLVDEDALYAALTTGHVFAAGLDVFVEEPAQQHNPLFALDNVVVSPHVAWLTQETWQRSVDLALENSRRLQANEELLHPVI